MKIERKIYAVVLVSILLAAGILSTIATRTITDTGDTVDTFIRNSKGNYWTATGANLALAITDMGDDGGTITVGSDITLTSELRLIYNDLTIDFQNNQVTLSGDISFVNVTSGVTNSVIKNAKVVPSSTATKSMIVLFLSSTAVWADRLYGNLFENIYFTSSEYNHTIIHFHIENDGGSHSSMLSNTFNKIYTWGCSRLIKLECDDADGWGNGNLFEDIFTYGARVGVEFTGSQIANGFNKNSFNNVDVQAQKYTTDGFKNIDGDYNRFTDCIVWDWFGAASPNYEWSVSSTAEETYISSSHLASTSVSDLGNSTFIQGGAVGHGYDKSEYSYIIYQNTTKTFVQSGSTGLILYKCLKAESQKAFNYVMGTYSGPTSAISVFVKNGIYSFPTGTPASYTTNMHEVVFIGENNQKSVIQAASGGTYAAGIFNVEESGGKNVTFRNLCFDGNNATGGARGIYVRGTESMLGLVIENCVFKYFNTQTWSVCIYTGESPTSNTMMNFRILNNDFYNNLYCIKLYGDADPSPVKYGTITGNYFSKNTYAINLAYVNNCTINNNIASSGTNGIAELSTCGYNMYLGNNFLACTTDYNIDTTTYKPTGQTNFTNLNFGTWT